MRHFVKAQLFAFTSPWKIPFRNSIWCITRSCLSSSFPVGPGKGQGDLTSCLWLQRHPLLHWDRSQNPCSPLTSSGLCKPWHAKTLTHLAHRLDTTFLCLSLHSQSVTDMSLCFKQVLLIKRTMAFPKLYVESSGKATSKPFRGQMFLIWIASKTNQRWEGWTVS